MNDVQAAKALGWFSIGLGTVQLAAPIWLGRQIGVGAHPGAMRVCGAREVATGVGILAYPEQASGLWARVAGDVLDLAALGAGAEEEQRGRAWLAMGMVLGVGLADAYFARRLSQNEADRTAAAAHPYGNMRVEVH